MTTTIRSSFILLTAVLFLTGYSFMSASWTVAPANPPANNAEAPINVSDTTQTKAGRLNLQSGASMAVATTGTMFRTNGSAVANIHVAGAEMRSPEYCDEAGANCWDPATGGPGGGGGLGEGQTWQNVTGSRTGGVAYQNTTGKPIAVYIGVASRDGFLYAAAPGQGWVEISGPDRDSGTTDMLHGIIPPGHWYYSTGNRGVWSELR